MNSTRIRGRPSSTFVRRVNSPRFGNEVVEARILQGIHFRFADVDARKQGEHIAQWAHSHYFRPVEEMFAPKQFDVEEFVGLK